MTIKNKTERVRRSRIILSQHANSSIIFSDEKLFLLQPSHNAQNDRIYAASINDVPIKKKVVERYQNVSSVMVWGAICNRGKLPLLFIDKGVKVNKEYYLEKVLKGHLQENAKLLFGDDEYVFQQDSAPAHKAKVVQEWLRQNVPNFIPTNEWPASSPDLNPLDFCIWGYMLGKLTDLKPMGLDRFKQLLIRIWDSIPDEVIRASCESFSSRLKLVIKHKGERIELFS